MSSSPQMATPPAAAQVRVEQAVRPPISGAAGHAVESDFAAAAHNGAIDGATWMNWLFDREHPAQAANRIIALVLALLPLFALLVLALQTPR